MSKRMPMQRTTTEKVKFHSSVALIGKIGKTSEFYDITSSKEYLSRADH